MGEFFPHISKSPKFHQINIIKITKKDCKKARERYQSLSKEKKKKNKQQYGRKRYRNVSEDKKQNLVEYRKEKNYKMRKKYLITIIRKIFSFRNFVVFSRLG